MTFTQYSSFFSLVIFSILLMPAVICGLCGKKIKYIGILISIPTLCMIMGTKSLQMAQFLIFLICESILIFSYYFIHKKTKSKFIYYTIFALSFLPIILIKSCIYFHRFNFLGFVGISYVSFRIWQLIIEIHDDHIERLPFLDMLYFITFFPTISSGPIDRYNRFIIDINITVSPKVYVDEFLIAGFKKIFWGIVYKFAIASFISVYIIDKLPQEKTLLSVIIYMYAYTLYLFFDFAGYSNFAVGTSYLLAVKSPENFNKPFLARNMKEFWDRWHISLSKWFGDYLFSRFVLNTLRKKVFKKKKTAIRCGYLLTMFTMGLWHGFSLFYITYGLYQGVMLVITDIYLKSRIYRKFKKSKYYDLVSRFVCFQVIAFGMLIFSGYLFDF